MTKSDFIAKVIGKPWSDRSCSFDKADCWGLVVLYYRHVMNKELHHAEGYESGEDFITCHERILYQWVVVEKPTDGCMISFFNGSNPNHVGIYIGGGKVLHSSGENGNIRVNNLACLMKIYSKSEFRLCLATNCKKYPDHQ